MSIVVGVFLLSMLIIASFSLGIAVACIADTPEEQNPWKEWRSVFIPFILFISIFTWGIINDNFYKGKGTIDDTYYKTVEAAPYYKRVIINTNDTVLCNFRTGKIIYLK